MRVLILEEGYFRHIIPYVDLQWDANYVFIITEYCGGGHLGTFIRQNKSLNEETTRKIFRQLASAMCYMWKRHITHMDLKPQNILIANRIDICIRVSVN